MAGKQSFASVFAAEMKRVVLKPKRLLVSFIFAAVAVVVQFGMMALANWSVNQVREMGESVGDVSALTGFMGFGMMVGILSLCFGIYAASFTARDYNDGTILASLVAIPKRTSFFLARMFPWVILSAVFSLIAAAGIIAVSINVIDDMMPVIIQALLATLAVAGLTTIGFCCGTITKKGSLAVLLFLALNTLLPMGLNLAGTAVLGGPEILRNLISWTQDAMPGNAIPALVDLVPFDAAGQSQLIKAGIALIWMIGSPILAGILFSKRATLGR